VMFIMLGVATVFVIAVVRNPFIGLMSLLGYSMIYMLFAREIEVGFNYGYVIEIFYALIWAAIIIKSSKDDWNRVNNELCLLFSLWFLISVLQLLNPAGADTRGWLHEIRTSGLDSFVVIPAGFMLIRNTKHLNTFFAIIISLSLLATLNGIKQVHLGMFPGESDFV